MDDPRAVNALVVRQWLPEWDDIHFDADRHQERPRPYFLMFSMRASVLRSLADTYRRDASAGTPRSEDISIQRRHDTSRSAEIKRFVEHGYPWSDLSATRRKSRGVKDLYKPGWLPTAVVVNLLSPGQTRQGRTLAVDDALEVTVTTEASGSLAQISMPNSWSADLPWKPTGAPPIEVIDGQHRLWAFDGVSDDEDYSLPVVAFQNLGLSWQAYLFWTINIKPKRINASLAFDLYPLLREQDWLEAGEGLQVYRETRAQELTEALWAVPSSPWYHRINMLGETGRRHEQPVTQAAFVRAITESFVKPWRASASRVGGLFGNNADDEGLDWNRTQQSALLIFLWQEIANAVKNSSAPWAVNLRELEDADGDHAPPSNDLDPALTSQYSLLSSDQGVRPVMALFNNLLVANAQRLALHEWVFEDEAADDLEPDVIEYALISAAEQRFAEMVRHLSVTLAKYDWRTSRTPKLGAEDRDDKLALRGSSGYSVFRQRLEDHIRQNGNRFTAAAFDALDHL